MVTSLNFSKTQDTWMAKFISEGSTIVEIKRTEPCTIIILANLEGMEPVIIGSYRNYVNYAIFNINVPKGLEVTIKSATEVLEAKIQIE